jgi:hypothetical protein
MEVLVINIQEHVIIVMSIFKTANGEGCGDQCRQSDGGECQ